MEKGGRENRSWIGEVRLTLVREKIVELKTGRGEAKGVVNKAKGKRER